MWSLHTSQFRDTRATRVADIEPGLQLRQPDLHALGELIGWIHDHQARAVQRDLRVTRVEPQFADPGFRGDGAREGVLPGADFALVLDRIPRCIDPGGESL